MSKNGCSAAPTTHTELSCYGIGEIWFKHSGTKTKHMISPDPWINNLQGVESVGKSRIKSLVQCNGVSSEKQTECCSSFGQFLSTHERTLRS